MSGGHTCPATQLPPAHHSHLLALHPAVQVWDRLDIQLPDRAIERDLRAIQQKVLVSGGGYGSSLHSSQDTEASHDSGASGSLAHAGGRPALLAAGRSHLGAAVPHHTSAHLSYPPPAMDEQQGQGGGASQQWRSRWGGCLLHANGALCVPATWLLLLQLWLLLPPATAAWCGGGGGSSSPSSLLLLLLH